MYLSGALRYSKFEFQILSSLVMEHPDKWNYSLNKAPVKIRPWESCVENPSAPSIEMIQAQGSARDVIKVLYVNIRSQFVVNEQ